MTELFASVNGSRVTKLLVRVPYSGTWIAEADLDTEIEIPTEATITIGALTLLGTVVPDSSGNFGNRTKLRIVGGKNGLVGVVPRKHYHSDAGVRVATIVGDIIRECGESPGVISPARAKAAADYVREASTGSKALTVALRGETWWVGADGLINVGARAQEEIEGTYELLDYDPRTKTATISTDSPEVIKIGSIIRSRLDVPIIVSEYEIQIDGGACRISACGLERTEDRVLQDLKRIAQMAFPKFAFALKYRFRVIDMVANRARLQAIRKDLGLPDILYVSIHPGAPGISAQLSPGSTVLVEFVEGDQELPIITGFADKDDPGFVPVETTIQAGATGAWPTEHVASIEGIANLLCQVAIQAPALITLLPPSLGGTGGLALALAAASSTPMDPTVKAAIVAALEAKQPDPTGLVPGVGWPSVRGA